jgi:predicted MFS family arabinose efflux permease
VSGIGMGTLVMPPLASLLIEAVGWRGAYLVLGALAVVIGGGLALLIENDPRDRNLGPDRHIRGRNRHGRKACRPTRPSARAASSACTQPA